MTNPHTFSLPIKDPVLIFTLVLFIILLVPVILRRTNIPSIVGLIITGIIIGPHAANIIAESDIIELFAKVGLFYIMFLAGLEIEFVEFRKNSVKGIFFGLVTFALPFLFGYYSARYLLDFDNLPSVLIGILLSSNTLIAFPIAGKLGITKTSAVNTAISGTVIADTLVLILLAFVTATRHDGAQGAFLWRFGISFSLFTVAMFYLLPRISRWFFRTITDGNLQYLFALTVLFASAFTAELAGAEPIIGAFFAGLALNRLIPHSSTLMNRIEFVGNSLFIPVFLISVGMLVNLGILVSGIKPIVYAALLLVLALSSKWLAAFFTKIIFRQSIHEMNVIFGLTSARAAATLAVALVGLQYGVLNKDIFNATILLIMLTSLFSSYITEQSGKKLALDEADKMPEPKTTALECILVPISNPLNIEKLIDLAILIRNTKSEEPIYPLAIVKDDEEASQRIAANEPLLEKVKKHAAASGTIVQSITRVDLNIPDAIIKASKELKVGTIVMGWSGKTNQINKVFGSVLENILKGTEQTVIVGNLVHPLNTTDSIIVTVPRNAEMEPGFYRWIEILSRLNAQLSAQIIFNTDLQTQKSIKTALEKKSKKINPSYHITDNQSTALINGDFKQDQPLHIIINARPHTISYNQKLWNMLYELPNALMDSNLLILYPEQHQLKHSGSVLQLD